MIVEESLSKLLKMFFACVFDSEPVFVWHTQENLVARQIFIMNKIIVKKLLL